MSRRLIAVGLCLGRIGCLLNGCCYGQVATTDCCGWQFPLSAPVRSKLVQAGYQTAAGFTLTEDNRVGDVEADSPADRSGLKSGDRIVRVQGKAVATSWNVHSAFEDHWPRGVNDLSLTVQHENGKEETLPSFRPLTLGVQPTQVYESISMALLFLLMAAFFPLRRHDGEIVSLLMIGYGLHRSLNEMLRGDVRPEGFEKYVSLCLIAAGIGLMLWLWRKPVQYKPAAVPAKN